MEVNNTNKKWKNTAINYNETLNTKYVELIMSFLLYNQIYRTKP